MSQLLDLQVEIAARPPDASSETAATITLRCEVLKLKREGDTFSYPLTKKERNDLRWYLEEYWQWPFEGFAQRGSTVEQLLPVLGQRLYQAVFGQGAARDFIQQWRADTTGAHQISIITTDAEALSLPWELLHDGQDFLALQANPPISILRRIAEEQQSSPSATTFEKPLRVLLVTARPVDEGQVDARTIAREVLDVLQDQIEAGNIALEFLRPPTMDELIARLDDKKHPVHILHFDGHGVFYQFPGSQDGNDEERGRLFFEKDDGKGDPVDAASLAAMLRYGGVQVAVLNACQSAAIGEKDIFSSMAVQLLQGSVQAVVAMSARVMTTSAALYVKAFYGALAAGGSVQAAHEQAQQVLHEHPERNPLQRRLREAGTPVNLQDWWLPYLYLQRPLALQPVREGPEPQQLLSTPTASCLNSALLDPPPYEFSGRSAELLHIERSLLPKKDGARSVVVISGFGGIGKTALAREAADWLTRTNMYDGACLISFENGGDVRYLLSELEKYLGLYDDDNSSSDILATVKRVKTALTVQHILVIVDNVENILPRGNAPLEENARAELYAVLYELRDMGAGILLICLDIGLSKELKPDGRIVYLPLQGLHPEDAYILASRLLEQLHIDRTNVPFPELSALLAELHYHPLAIQRVLPALREHSVEEIRAHFDKWLPMFRDDAETGRHYSLVTSLNYSLRRLTEEQQSKLPLLAPFEGGASEEVLLAITQIPEKEWKQLRQALEQAALVIPESVYLRFHPVFAPFLRSQFGIDAALRERYMQLYLHFLYYLYQGQSRDTQRASALMRQELPNLLQALYFLMEREGDLEGIFLIANIITTFLNVFGMEYERDQLLKRVTAVAAIMRSQQGEGLAKAGWIEEFTAGKDEIAKGNLRAATTRFTTLLARMEALPEGSPLGAGSFEHSMTLTQLAQCFIREQTQYAAAEKLLRKALDNMDRLLRQQPDDRDYLNERAAILGDLGSVLSHLGQRGQARTMFEEALKIHTLHGDLRNQAAVLGELGILAAIEGKSDEAKAYYMKARDIFRELNEPAMEAVAWYRLGRIAEECGELEAAEQYFRESLILRERHADVAGIPDVLNYLALVARRSGRPSEAESWFKRALALDEQLYPQSYLHACHYNDLAFLLMSEVRDGRAPKLRLAEAKDYAQRALAIMETLDPSAEIWAILGTLADIASLEGQPEIEQNYRRRARETYAAYEGNRDDIDRRYGSNILGVVAAAKGNAEARRQVEGILPDAEQDSWHITAAVQRIWAGERDWHALAENLDLDVESALLVLRVLELLAQPTEEPEQVFASLPAEMQQAMKQNDPSAFQQAFNALPLEKKMAIGEAFDRWKG